MRRASRALLCSSMLLGLAWHALARSQELPAGYPSRPIRIIVSSVPGGAHDIICRAIAQTLSDRWGQSVIVDNRPGGGTVLATEVASKAAPDGYTFFAGTDTLRVLGITRRVSFDVRKTFEPVVPTAAQPYILIVTPGLPASNIKELIAYSQTKPVSYGSSGVGTVAHIGLEYFTSQSGAKFVHVPYKGGAQSLLALLSGEIQMYPGLFISANGAIKAGKARPLAAMSLKRIPAAPDLPTIAEQGFPDVNIKNSYGLFAPAGTSRRVINALNRVVGEFMNSPPIAQKLLAEGSQPGERMTAEEYRTLFFVREYEEVERQLKQLKVKLY